MEELLLPNSITYTDGDKANTGEVVVTPCYHGYGTTLGNMYRRVLLSSLPGAAATAVKIKGVSHEFDGIDSVKEDVVQVMLNLKKLRVRVHAEGEVKLSLKKKGAGAVTAADFEATSDVDVVNPDLHIAEITGSDEFEMEVIVKRGRGFVTVEEREEENLELGMIGLDAVFSPVVDMGYSVDNTRVGDVTNYEKLTMKIETDGTITPKEAVDQSTQILLNHLNIIQSGEGAAPAEAEVEEAPEVSEEEASA